MRAIHRLGNLLRHAQILEPRWPSALASVRWVEHWPALTIRALRICVDAPRDDLSVVPIALGHGSEHQFEDS